jgi:glycine cleavage system H protein
MKVKDYEVPDDLFFTKEHEWAKGSGNMVRVGITDYAAKTLNDVVYVTLPKVGEHVTQFKPIGTVESIKAVSELYSPLSGSVTGVNQTLNSHPELVNKSPYAEGWLVEIRPDDFASDSKKLLNAKGYAKHLEITSSKESHD